jgi:hypothetical protein
VVRHVSVGRAVRCSVALMYTLGRNCRGVHYGQIVTRQRHERCGIGKELVTREVNDRDVDLSGQETDRGRM